MRAWKRQIDGYGPIADRFSNGEATFEETRDAAVAVFKADQAYAGDNMERASAPCADELYTEAVWDLAEAQTEDDFVAALEAIYDWADDARVWIAPT